MAHTKGSAVTKLDHHAMSRGQARCESIGDATTVDIHNRYLSGSLAPCSTTIGTPPQNRNAASKEVNSAGTPHSSSGRRNSRMSLVPRSRLSRENCAAEKGG
jgi:hypothetical protein